MRAATAIVGAVALASCLIAVAFLASGHHGDSSQGTRTASSTSKQQPAAQQSQDKAAAAPSEGLTQCGSGEGEISVEGVSCQVGVAIHHDYQSGSRGQLLASDPVTGKEIAVTCETSAPVICTDGGRVNIYFAP